MSIALTILEIGASDLLAVLKYKSSKSGKKWPIFGLMSLFVFTAVATKRGWEPLVGGFGADSMHMLLLKTHPIWVRFSEAAERQSQKRAIFHFFQKNGKNRFLQVTKVDRSQQPGEIWSSNLSHRHLTKMHCSHLENLGKIQFFLGEQ